MSGRRLSLGQNATVNLGGKTISLVLSLFVSAFVVHRLGLRTFGFWAVIAGVSQYAQLLDFGVGPALTRFVAHLDQQGEHATLERRAASAFWGSVAFAVALTLVAAAVVLLFPDSIAQDWPAGWRIAVVAIGSDARGRVDRIRVPGVSERHGQMGSLEPLSAQRSDRLQRPRRRGAVEQPKPGRAGPRRPRGCRCHLCGGLRCEPPPLAVQAVAASCDEVRPGGAVALRLDRSDGQSRGRRERPGGQAGAPPVHLAELRRPLRARRTGRLHAQGTSGHGLWSADQRVGARIGVRRQGASALPLSAQLRLGPRLGSRTTLRRCMARATR